MHGTRARRLRSYAYLFLVPTAMFAVGWGLLWYAETSLETLFNDQVADFAHRPLETLHTDRLRSGQLGQFAQPDTSGAIPGKQEERVLIKAYARASTYAKASMLSAIVAIITGGIAVMLTVLLGRRAAHSREHLITFFRIAHDTLLWLMALEVLLSAVTLLLLGIPLVWFIHDTFITLHDYRYAWMLEVYAIFIGLSATWVGARGFLGLRHAFNSFQPAALTQWGREVSEMQAPGLWTYIRQIAAKTSAHVPKHVAIGLTNGFYVTAHDILLMPEQRLLTGETLYLPLTHVALMRPGEIDCIIGHELAHFSGSDTQFTLSFIPLHARMSRRLKAIELHLKSASGHVVLRPALLMAEFVMERLHHAIAHWSRQRELAADRTGMEVANPQTYAAALIRSEAICPLIEDYLGEVAQLYEPGSSDILRGLLDHAGEQSLPLPDLESDATLFHPTDTHPPTRERIAAIGVELTPQLLATACAAADTESVTLLDRLVQNRPKLQMQLWEDLFSGTIEQNRAYKSLLETVAQDTAQAITIYEYVEAKRTGLTITALLSLLALAVAGLRFGSTSPPDQALPWIVAGLGGLTILCMVMRVLWLKRGQIAIAVFAPTGLSSPGLCGEIPWSQMIDIRAKRIWKLHLTLQFYLDDTGKPPKLIDRNHGRIKWYPKTRSLQLSMTRVSGFTHEDVLELIIQFRTAAYAHTELQSMRVLERRRKNHASDSS